MNARQDAMSGLPPPISFMRSAHSTSIHVRPSIVHGIRRDITTRCATMVSRSHGRVVFGSTRLMAVRRANGFRGSRSTPMELRSSSRAPRREYSFRGCGRAPARCCSCVAAYRSTMYRAGGRSSQQGHQACLLLMGETMLKRFDTQDWTGNLCALEDRGPWYEPKF